MKRNENTNPVTVIVWSDKNASERYLKLMMDAHDFCHKAGLKPVQMHRKKFGKQNFCFVGEFRYWVWDIDVLRLYISNNKGICFEVKSGTDIQKTMEVLEKYYKLLTT